MWVDRSPQGPSLRPLASGPALGRGPLTPSQTSWFRRSVSGKSFRSCLGAFANGGWTRCAVGSRNCGDDRSVGSLIRLIRPRSRKRGLGGPSERDLPTESGTGRSVVSFRSSTLFRLSSRPPSNDSTYPSRPVSRTVRSPSLRTLAGNKGPRGLVYTGVSTTKSKDTRSRATSLLRAVSVE